MVKQFDLLKRQGHAGAIRPEWEQEVRRLADAFVRTWEKQGTWGNYVHVETGDVAVFRTTGGAMAVGGLALASVYYNDRLICVWRAKRQRLSTVTSLLQDSLPAVVVTFCRMPIRKRRLLWPPP